MQEVALAHSIMIRCGDASISWEAMRDLVNLTTMYEWDVRPKPLQINVPGYGDCAFDWFWGLKSMCEIRGIVQLISDPGATASSQQRLSTARGILLDSPPERNWWRPRSRTTPIRMPPDLMRIRFSMCAFLLKFGDAVSCSVEHDKVYGFLGIFNAVLGDAMSGLVQVDYKKPVTLVYQELVTSLLEKSQNLDIITMQLPSLRDSSQQCSWMIDFRKPLPKSGLFGGQTACASQGLDAIARTAFEDTGYFQVRDLDLNVFGGELDDISHIIDFQGTNYMLTLLEQLSEILPSKPPGRRWLNVVARTLVAYDWAHTRGNSDSYTVHCLLSSMLLATVARDGPCRDENGNHKNLSLARQVERFVSILGKYDFPSEQGRLDIYIDWLHRLLENSEEAIQQSDRVRPTKADKHEQFDSSEIVPSGKRETLRRLPDENPSSLSKNSLTQELSGHLSRNKAAYNYSVAQGMSPGRYLFLTKRGFLGSCPRSAQVGDSVWILCKASAPWVLRRAVGMSDSSAESSDLESWNYVGDSFMLDFMNGEALRGEYGLAERLRRIKIV